MRTGGDGAFLVNLGVLVTYIQQDTLHGYTWKPLFVTLYIHTQQKRRLSERARPVSPDILQGYSRACWYRPTAIKHSPASLSTCVMRDIVQMLAPALAYSFAVVTGGCTANKPIMPHGVDRLVKLAVSLSRGSSKAVSVHTVGCVGQGTTNVHWL